MRLSPERRRPALLGACGIAGVAVLLGAPVWAAVLGLMGTAYAIGLRPDASLGDEVYTGGLSSSDDSGDAGGDSDGGSE